MARRFRSFAALRETLGDISFDRPPAFVANAHVTGLGVARALADHGVPVIALDRIGDGVAPYSEAVEFAGEVTYPLDDVGAFGEDLAALSAEVAHDPVYFGCMDEWVHGLVAADPDGIVRPFSDRSVIDAVLNKESLYSTAERLGVPYPETYRIRGIGGDSVLTGDAAPHRCDPAEVLEELSFPLVLKPALKRRFAEAIGTNVIEVTERREYDEVLEAADDADVRVMAQEKVPVARGDDHSYVSYVPPNGDAIGIVGNPLVRYPQGYGTSCVVDHVAEPVIEQRARAVLSDAGYHGISEAEFVYDSDRGEYVLLDVNTRPWKWIDLPVSTGVNLPYAAYADAVNDEYEPDLSDSAGGERWIYLADYLRLCASDEEGTDVLTPDHKRALLSGAFETREDLTTGVFLPSDPDPARQLLATETGTREYYCSC